MSGQQRGIGALTIEALRRAADQVSHELGLRLLILVGSAARDGLDVAEDLDIAFLAGGPVDSVQLTNHLIRAIGVQEIDVSDLGRVDPLFLMLAARDGRLLYESAEGEFARFASLAVRRYADTRKFREMERREIQDFIERVPGR